MKLFLSGHSYHYECANLCRLFFPYSPVEEIKSPCEDENNEPYAEAVILQNAQDYTYKVLCRYNGKSLCDEETRPIHDEYTLTRMLYRTLERITGNSPKWGMLTGIHPVKLLGQYEDKLGETAAKETFKQDLFVSNEKYTFAKRTLDVQRPFLKTGENDFSLYVGIPFCPSRCSYCSFVSQSVGQAKKLIEPYFDLLLLEIDKTAEIVKSLGLNLISVYIGGGTPTTLSAHQLKKLCEKIANSFDMGNCLEFTVEAGRADTISKEKLIVLKACGVTRISINPQSLSDKVLRAIGREHTADDVRKAFDIAKAAGFISINADLIVGLPEDSLEGFKKTLKEIIRLGASNITVHSLALKRSASLIEDNRDISSHKNASLADDMINFSVETLSEAGFEPYYMYRQTRMAGNLENTGWAKNGNICRYNICTMDESSTVIACGAGGVSKIKNPYGPELKRIFNFKFPNEYISRNSEIIERKARVEELYEQFRKRIH